MANGAIAGGIGAGILGGLQFMRQREADARQDQALQNQNTLLQMQQQEHGEKMGAFNRANEERNRVEMYNALQTQVENVYGQGPDALPEYDRKKMVIDNALGAGIIKPDELALAKKSYDAAISFAGVDAFDAAIKRGDLAPLNKILTSKGMGSAAAGTDGTIKITGLDGSVQQFKPSDLLNLQIMSGAYDREATRAKAALDARKTNAEITRTEADARLKDRLPQDRFGLSASGLGLGPGKGNKEDKFNVFKDAKDYSEAVGGADPFTKQPFPWTLTGYQHFNQLSGANPELANSPSGAAYILNMSKALGQGSAQAAPEIDQNGNVSLVATWPGSNGKGELRKLPLQKNIDPSAVIDAQGVGGNLIVKPEDWARIQGNAIQSYAKSRPDEYRLAAAASADDDAMEALAQRAQTNPDAARALNFAKMVRSLTAQQKKLPESSRRKLLSEEESRVAEALGYDPDAPSVIDRASDAGNRFLSAARGIIASANGDQFESAIRMAQRAPDMPGVRRKLFEMARGNPERMARIREVFGAKDGQ